MAKTTGMDFSAALKRPFQDGTKLIIGCALNIIPIVNFLSMGYVLKSGQLTLNKKYNLPEWADWGNLFIAGLLATIIGIIWMIPALVVGMIGGGAALGSIMSAAGGMSAAGIGAFAGAGVLMLLAALLALLAAYFLPSAILEYVNKENFGAAFDFSTIFKKALTGNYFVAWIVALIVFLVLGIVSSAIPYLGIILNPAANFISAMIGITLIGSIYKKL